MLVFDENLRIKALICIKPTRFDNILTEYKIRTQNTFQYVSKNEMVYKKYIDHVFNLDNQTYYLRNENIIGVKIYLTVFILLEYTYDEAKNNLS